MYVFQVSCRPHHVALHDCWYESSSNWPTVIWDESEAKVKKSNKPFHSFRCIKKDNLLQMLKELQCQLGKYEE
jgi:hypothetical protein